MESGPVASAHALREVAIVTGGTGSIGRAICAELTRRGLLVVAADMDTPDGAIDDILFRKTDVADGVELEVLFAEAATYGRVAVLVAAHGIVCATEIGETDGSDADSVLDINLLSVAKLCNAAARSLPDDSAVILLGSIAGSIGRLKGSYAYQAAKAGIEALTRAFAVGLGPRRIRVNCVAPGFVNVAMKGAGALVRDQSGGQAQRIGMTPIGRLIGPEEVAAAVAFLASSEASAITGVVLPVDGGVLAY